MMFLPFSNKKMPGIDPNIAMHSLNVQPECKSIKQRKRRMNEEKIAASISEIEKLVKVSFIKEVQYPE